MTEHISRADLAEAARLDQDAVRFHPEEIVASLEGLGVDHLGALAVSFPFFGTISFGSSTGTKGKWEDARSIVGCLPQERPTN